MFVPTVLFSLLLAARRCDSFCLCEPKDASLGRRSAISNSTGSSETQRNGCTTSMNI
jgi:hypothetical protein